MNKCRRLHIVKDTISISTLVPSFNPFTFTISDEITHGLGIQFFSRRAGDRGEEDRAHHQIRGRQAR